MPRIDGIDVSEYQEKIDWVSVKKAGIDWVAMRATLGTKKVDARFYENRVGTEIMKFRHRLFYHFMTPSSPSRSKIPRLRIDDAKKQAAHFLNVAKTLKPGEGVILDVEHDLLHVDQVLAWCQIVEAALGRPVSIYTGVYVSGGSIWRSKKIFDGTRPRILAAYIDEKLARERSAPFIWDAWQWTDRGRFSGVKTLVDLDQVDDVFAFDKICGLDKTFDPKNGFFFNYPTKNKYAISRPATGNIVAYLQGVILNRAGGGIVVDGKFGPQTEQRVKDLQSMFKLHADGVVGPETWAVIDFLASIPESLYNASK